MANSQSKRLLEYKNFLATKKIRLLDKLESNINVHAFHLCLVCNHKWKPFIGNVKNGAGCPVCSLRAQAQNRNDRNRDAYDSKLKAKNSRLRRLTPYVDGLTLCKFACACGFEFERKPTHLLMRPKCPACDCQKKQPSEQAKQVFLDLLKSRNIKLVGSYVNSVTKVKLKCAYGHEWQTRPSVIKDGSGCPECAVVHSYSYRKFKIEGRTFHLQGYEDIALHWLVKGLNLDVRKIRSGKSAVKKFNYRLKDQTRTYYPDFLVGKRAVVEVKSLYTAGLVKMTSPTCPSFAALKAKARAVIKDGYGFNLLLLRINKGKVSRAVVPEGWWNLSRKEFLESIKWLKLSIGVHDVRKQIC